MRPEIFGWQHFTYLGVFAVLLTTSIILIKKFVKDEKVLTYIVKGFAGVLLACLLFNRISIVFKNDDWWCLIPNTFCGMSSLLLSLSVLVGKKNCGFFHYICYIGFVGAFLTLIYPDFIGQDVSFWYAPTISGLLHHTVMLWLIILMVVFKYFEPTFKMWYWLPLGLCCTMTFGVFLITILEFESAMYITEPLLEGTIFNWFFTGLIVHALSYGIMLIFDYLRKVKNKKHEVVTIENNNKDESINTKTQKSKNQIATKTARKSTKTTK